MLPLMVVLILVIAGTLSDVGVAQTLSERARKSPGTPIVTGLLREIPPEPIETLTAGADLVLEGQLSRIKSYLTANDEYVQTDYQILPSRVFVGTLPGGTSRPGVLVPLVLSAYGGEVVVDGVPIRATDHNLETLTDGGRFLLFLKRFGTEPGRYQLHNGGAFEIRQDGIKPLLRQSERAYKDIATAPYEEVVLRVQKAAQARSEPR